MKTTNLLLAAAVIASLNTTSFATDAQNQVLGNSNKVDFLNSSNVVGNNNEVVGGNNIVVGDHNDVSGYSTISIGNNIYSHTNQYNSTSYSPFSPNGKGNIAIGDHTKIDQEANTAIGHLAQAWGNASVAVGAYSMAFDDVHKTDTKYAGSNSKGVFSIGSGYSTLYDMGAVPPAEFQVFTRQLQNVGAGEISSTSTDAVNGSQLYDVMLEAQKHSVVESGDDNIVVNSDGTGMYTVSTNKDLKAETLSLSDGNSESTYSVKGVSMIYRDGDNSTEHHTSYNYDGMRIDINDGDAQPINSISLTDKGLNNGNNKIINVSKGENDTDAVNISQLKEVKHVADDNRKVLNNHENRIGDLENKVTDVGRNVLDRANSYTDTQVNKGVAKASALAGLQFLDYNPRDKWSFAASIGHYRNANAVAVGAAYQPNQDTMIHGGITLDSKVAYNLGVSFKTGGKEYVNKYVLQDQVKQLQADNAELRQELKDLRAMIEKK